MSQPIITVENLSKAYRIGLKEEIPDTLVGAMTSWARAPLQNWRRLRRLNTFDLSKTAKHNGNGTSVAEKDRPAEEEEDIIWALRDVSFEVKEGEVIGIIGRNGAGKSTLLKILSRITEPTSGRAVIRGRVSSLLEVGTGFHPELTGRENIYMNGTILGMTKREIDRKFDEIVDFSGVEKFLDTPVKRYSSGMKVRLAFAVAAHLDPEILIVDEVLAVGDMQFQEKCLGKMKQLTGDSRTVLFVSHNLEAIKRLCCKVLLLADGTVCTAGLPSNVIDRYATAQVRARSRPLADRKDRTGSGEIRLIECLVNGTSSSPVNVPVGESVKFTLRGANTTRVSRCYAHVAICDHFGGPLIHCSSRSYHHMQSVTSHEVVFTCEISRLPLPPGRYQINVALTADGASAIYDRVTNVVALHVSGGDFFGTGDTSAYSYGRFLVDCVWS